ncbi:MAG: IS1182 family transposase, partial [Chloroflexota bacterium]|nr:IS1182 family transposase [Chloroflexota bacterium]
MPSLREKGQPAGGCAGRSSCLKAACDREQTFLMPPDVREWLPESHLPWFVTDAVELLDLA